MISNARIFLKFLELKSESDKSVHIIHADKIMDLKKKLKFDRKSKMKVKDLVKDLVT